MNRDEYIAQLNARQHMTQEERDMALLREAFGPLFDLVFGPQEPQQEQKRGEQT